MNNPLTVPVVPRPSLKASWTGIAFICGVVVLIVGLGYLYLISSFITKAGQRVREISENPAATTAGLIVRENPDWTIVRADDKAREITLRNLDTNEETTISYEDPASGNFSIKGTDGSKMEMKGGKIEISNAHGEKTVIGAGDSPPPMWVPNYPNVARRDVSLTSFKEGRHSGSLSFSTTDTPQKVKAFYSTALAGDGWKVVDTTQIGQDAARLLVLKMEMGEGDARQVFNLMASCREDNNSSTSVQIIWEAAKTANSRS
jgi:hypothetical protein